MADDPACLNLRWSLALFDGLVRAGLRDLVLSPGSRSTPLVLAAQRQPEVRLTAILDERSAAFFALGLARAERRPVALLCTSGSAPAHWLPAVIEAAEWGLPLILLSADRPPELRGWGANQTIDQARLFGPFIREFHDPGPATAAPAALKALHALGARCAAVSLGPRPGPVHINLPLREPLVPGPDCQASPRPRAELGHFDPMAARETPPAKNADWLRGIDPQWLAKGPGLIVCGPGDYDRATREALWHCSDALDLPVLVDPLSGLRFGPASCGRVTHYDSLARNPAAMARLRPAWVIRLGRAPVSKRLGEWLTGVPSILLDPAERWHDPTHDALVQIGGPSGAVLRELTEAGLVMPDPDWLAHWQDAERRIAALSDRHLGESCWCEGHLMRLLIERLPAGEALLCANSLPIRQLDTWSGARMAPLAVFGNRGASGIDGQLSTLAGLNAAGLPTWGLLGDLSLCHDLSGLLLADRLSRPLLVLNNGGGRIFDYLPQRDLPGIATLWRTPLRLDLAKLADTFGLRHWRVTHAAEFETALEQAGAGGPGGLIEVVIDASGSQAMHEAFWRRATEASIGSDLGP